MKPEPCRRALTSEGIPRGFFVTLEGIEGSGKTTHARALESGLRDRGFPVLLTREPGGTPLAEALRNLVLGTEGEAPVAEAELFMILAARAQHLRRVILPRLDAGEVVISDRFADASLAYQGGGRGLGVDAVAAANTLATSGIVPDLTVLCDVPVENALDRVERREKDGGAFDRLDQENRRFYETVRATYLDLAAREPDRFLVVSSTGPKEELARKLLEEVGSRLRARREAGGLG